VTPIRLERNISKTGVFIDSVPKYHQYEMAWAGTQRCWRQYGRLC